VGRGRGKESGRRGATVKGKKRIRRSDVRGASRERRAKRGKREVDIILIIITFDRK
jgi:hypothetical protein